MVSALLLEFDQARGSPHALPQVQVFYSAGLGDIEPAQPSATGKSGDWINAIHLTPRGYCKLRRAFGRANNSALKAYL